MEHDKMEQDNTKRNFDEMPALPTRDEGPGWAIPIAVGAVVLVAGILIFNAAGPERTRTAGFNNSNAPAASAPAQPTDPQRSESATPAQTPAPQKSNPAGTQ
jgi:hypothetical protein